MRTSPFPGMDPFLESRWPEVHARLIVYAANQINQTLPEDLQANIEENLAVSENDARSSIRPDIHISHEPSFTDASVRASGATVADPLVIKMAPQAMRHIEIADKGGRVVTAIEFLSPWNKIGLRAREQYARKQVDYMHAGISLVEIDLVRRGAYVLAAPIEAIPAGERTPYLICIYRHQQPDQFEIYRAPLSEPLPNIPIPLRYGEQDVVLELQVLIDQNYQDGRYYRMDYTVDTQGKFEKSQVVWIDHRLRSAGLRA